MKNGRTKQAQSNIEMIQSMLYKNHSIEEISHVMSEHSNNTHGWHYWHERVLNLIEDGELVA